MLQFYKFRILKLSYNYIVLCAFLFLDPGGWPLHLDILGELAS